MDGRTRNVTHEKHNTVETCGYVQAPTLYVRSHFLLIRGRLGMHKHFRMLAIVDALRNGGSITSTEGTIRPQHVWEKLEELYNLEALDERVWSPRGCEWLARSLLTEATDRKTALDFPSPRAWSTRFSAISDCRRKTLRTAHLHVASLRTKSWENWKRGLHRSYRINSGLEKMVESPDQARSKTPKVWSQVSVGFRLPF